LGGGITSEVVRNCSGSRRKTEPRGRGVAKLARVSELACVITCFVFLRRAGYVSIRSLPDISIRQHT
jgi:hypothetical protein